MTTIKNANVLQTIDRIYLRSLYKIQVVHEIFYLRTHKVITRQKNIEIQIPREIINPVGVMVACDKVTSLKFKNIAGFMYDNHWIAGV